jgi:phage tail tape-measure protein
MKNNKVKNAVGVILTEQKNVAAHVAHLSPSEKRRVLMKVANVATGAIGALGSAFSSLQQGMIGGNAEFERYETQFGVLLGSASAAKDRLAELAKFGAETPFELPEVVRADKILQAFGLHSAETAKKFGMSGTQIRTIAALEFIRIINQYGFYY